MPKQTEVEFEGKLVPAIELDFDTQKEPWTIYTLQDGATLRFKQALVSIWKLEGQTKPGGEPIYVYKLAAMVNVEPPAATNRE